MNNASYQLNLTRKWRSLQFDQLVGQELCKRILKNSLFCKQFFPAYLFAGERGCGKTTTARIFAAALNCQNLTLFQQKPQLTQLPCLQCKSCIAMQQGKHPDFLEIDAASHTGVDNIRSLLEAASLLPVLGTYKIYAIDEAHMLSKSAFNALLKILEEPPHDVFFILATTDPDKIVDTVRSRCFSLFFKPVAYEDLKEHLMKICRQEEIQADKEAIHAIVEASGGLVRDAINLLEQARLSASIITKKAVLQVLGKLDDEQLLHLIDYCLHKPVSDFLIFIQTIKLSTYNSLVIWESIIELLRALIWQKYDITIPRFLVYKESLQELSKRCSLAELQKIMKLFYDHQEILKKSSRQYSYLEFLLISLVQKKRSFITEGNPCPAVVTHSLQNETYNDIEDEEGMLPEEREDIIIEDSWAIFLKLLSEQDDPLILSIFSHAWIDMPEHESTKPLHVENTFSDLANKIPEKIVFLIQLPFKFSLYKDFLLSSLCKWQPLLNQAFKATLQVELLFQSNDKRKNNGMNEQEQAQTVVANEAKIFKKNILPTFSTNSVLNFSPKEQWVKTHLLLKSFPGTISILKG